MVSKAKVFVIPGSNEDRDVAQMFFENDCEIVKSIKSADMVVFVGGDDIDPALYNQKQTTVCHSNVNSRKRDEAEAACYKALSPNQVKVGICRGGQLLNVLNGGSMFQHVNGHLSGGNPHRVLIRNEMDPAYLNSYHHQMMIPNFDDPSLEILGVAAMSTIKENDQGVYWGQSDFTEDPDYEILYYGNSKSFCFQPHPEWQEGTRRTFFRLLKKLNLIP